MWDLPGPGLEPVSPASAGGFLTTVPPGKPTFSSLIHFEFIFVYGVKECSNFIFLHVAVVFPAPFIEETVFSPLNSLASFVVDKLTIGVWVCFWAFYPAPLISISVFVPVPYGFVFFNK